MAPLVQSEALVSEPSYSPRSVWEQSSDGTANSLSETLQNFESVLTPANWWVDPNASSLINFEITQTADESEDFEKATPDPDLSDRLALLVKKYADESTSLRKEDSARLGILNNRVDLKYSRYGDNDFETINEADDILEKFKKLGENRN